MRLDSMKDRYFCGSELVWLQVHHTGKVCQQYWHQRLLQLVGDGMCYDWQLQVGVKTPNAVQIDRGSLVLRHQKLLRLIGEIRC